MTDCSWEIVPSSGSGDSKSTIPNFLLVRRMVKSLDDRECHILGGGSRMDLIHEEGDFESDTGANGKPV